MSSTFTGPIRVNTRQTTSNDGTISADNTGAVVLTQQKPMIGTSAATIVVPAGSVISGFQDYIVSGTNTATPTITVGGTSVATIALTPGVNTATISATTGAATVLSNVGTADATISVAGEAGVTGIFSVTYTQRNSDGTIAPYGSGYTNN